MRVIHVPVGPPADIAKERLLPYTGTLVDYMTARMRQEPDPVDVMHANCFASGEAVLRVKNHLGIPLVMTFHALDHVRWLHQSVTDGFPDERFAIEDTLARRADRLIAECPRDGLDRTTPYRADAARIWSACFRAYGSNAASRPRSRACRGPWASGARCRRMSSACAAASTKKRVAVRVRAHEHVRHDIRNPVSPLRLPVARAGCRSSSG